MTDKLKFLKELSKLLKNYDASISWGCDPASDLHGVIDDHISIDVRNVKLRFNDCYIDEYEIDKYIEEIEEADVNQCM